MNSTSLHHPSTRFRRLGLGLLLLAVPACGLSEYETLMRDAQEREKRFQDEQTYLDQPVAMPKDKVPTGKGKEEREEAVANVFFRPPKGIGATPTKRDNLLWRYSAGATATDFYEVNMAFARDDKDFANKVVGSYGTTEQPTSRSWQFTPPRQNAPLIFDTWEFAKGEEGYSINVLRSLRPIAIVYIYNKARYESARKAINVSLQSLAVDPQQIGAARERFSRPTPWRLEGKSAQIP